MRMNALQVAVWKLMSTDDYEIISQDETSATLEQIHDNEILQIAMTKRIWTEDK